MRLRDEILFTDCSDCPESRSPLPRPNPAISLGCQSTRMGRPLGRYDMLPGAASAAGPTSGESAMNASLTGAEFKKQLRAGRTKLGLFLNSHSPTVAEQLAHSGYDWLLVDTQHGPMGNESLSGMLAGIANGGATSMVRVGGYSDRPCIQQSLDMGADG